MPSPLGQGYVIASLLMTGSRQALISAVDANGVALSANPLFSGGMVYASTSEIQNDPESSARIRWVYYQKLTVGGSVPAGLATLDKTNSFGIAIGASMADIKSEENRLRADTILLNNVYVQGTAGDYLHIRIPIRQEQFA